MLRLRYARSLYEVQRPGLRGEEADRGICGVSCLPAEVVQGNGGSSADLRMTLLHDLDSHDNTAPRELEHLDEICFSRCGLTSSSTCKLRRLIFRPCS
jgi:hypothetical protein